MASTPARPSRRRTSQSRFAAVPATKRPVSPRSTILGAPGAVSAEESACGDSSAWGYAGAKSEYGSEGERGQRYRAGSSSMYHHKLLQRVNWTWIARERVGSEPQTENVTGRRSSGPRCILGRYRCILRPPSLLAVLIWSCFLGLPWYPKYQAGAGAMQREKTNERRDGTKGTRSTHGDMVKIGMLGVMSGRNRWDSV